MNAILTTHADEITTDYPMKMVCSPVVFVFKQALECQGDGKVSSSAIILSLDHSVRLRET